MYRAEAILVILLCAAMKRGQKHEPVLMAALGPTTIPGHVLNQALNVHGINGWDHNLSEHLLSGL